MHQCRLPDLPGVGFKPEHAAEIAAGAPGLGFFEVHAENCMSAGGPSLRLLDAVRAKHALSVHGVGLSIGGPGRLDQAHLARVKAVCDRWQPESFSEHLAWSSHDGGYLNDLLPLPYTGETLTSVCDHIDEVQTVLGRQMLLENPASYLGFEASEMSEPAFLAEIARRTGCGLLLDVNNVFVSAVNLRTDPMAYLAEFPLDLVGEIHLAGHAQEALDSGPLLIDDHGSPVAEPVWALYGAVIARTGPVATLIEWDNDVPAFAVLLDEAARAGAVLAAARRRHVA